MRRVLTQILCVVIIAGGDGDPTMSTPGGGITKYENAEAGEDPAAEEEAATTS